MDVYQECPQNEKVNLYPWHVELCVKFRHGYYGFRHEMMVFSSDVIMFFSFRNSASVKRSEVVDCTCQSGQA